MAAAIQPSLNSHMEALLIERFGALESSLNDKLVTSQKAGWDRTAVECHSLLASIRSQVEDLRKAFPSALKLPEPPILADCFYS